MPVAATVVAGTAYQVERGQSAAREQRRASRAESRAREVSAAQQENERQSAIRQQLRQERIRQAQVLSAAQAAGVSGSSVEATTIGSGQTLAAAGQAFATGATEANRQQSAFLQQGAHFRSAASLDAAQGQLGGAVANLGMSAFQSGFGKTSAPTYGPVPLPAETGVNLDYSRFANYS